jgi:hypothetical protein
MLRYCPQGGSGKGDLSTGHHPPCFGTSPPLCGLIFGTSPPLKPIASSGRFFPVVVAAVLWKREFGQPKRAEVFMLRGLRPVLRGEYLRVLACQIRPTGRQGRSFAWLSRSHALSQPGHPRPNPDRLRALR